ncbi:MAG: porin [Pseudomonadota bacterium]
MKRIAAGLGLMIGASLAWADGEVRVSGRVTGGLAYEAAPAGRSALRFSSDWGPSLLIIKGREELGAGLAVQFHLEDGFSLGDGKSDGIFNRQAMVGIASADWGSLMVGRALSLSDGELWAVDPGGMQTTAIETLVNGRIWGPRSNALTYASPQRAGFSLRLQGALGERPGNARAGRQLGAALSYVDAGWTFKAIVDEARDANGRFTDLYNSSRQLALGAKYTQGAASWFGGVCQLSSDRDTVADAFNPLAATRNRLAWLGVNVRTGGALTLVGAAYHAALDKGAGSATLLVAGVKYALSKNTELFATAGRAANRGKANFAVVVYADRPTPGSAQNGAYVGIVQHW